MKIKNCKKCEKKFQSIGCFGIDICDERLRKLPDCDYSVRLGGLVRNKKILKDKK